MTFFPTWELTVKRVVESSPPPQQHNINDGKRQGDHLIC
jgi:hypothetical protein